MRQLKQSVEAVTNASPEKLVEQILAYASRPLTEFNKYEVLEMLETLHNKAADRNHDREKLLSARSSVGEGKGGVIEGPLQGPYYAPIRRQGPREGPGYRF